MSTIILRNDNGEIKGKMKLSQEATYKLWRERNELQARVKELETQRDELLNQFRILSDDFNSGEYNQYECAFAISDLITKIEAEKAG